MSLKYKNIFFRLYNILFTGNEEARVSLFLKALVLKFKKTSAGPSSGKLPFLLSFEGIVVQSICAFKLAGSRKSLSAYHSDP